MRKRIWQRRKKNENNEEMALQITSMADIFTIILVFLLKSYSTGISNLAPTGDMTLPESKAEASFKDTLRIEINRDAITVDQTAVTVLKNFSAGIEDLEAGGKSASVYKALMQERTRKSMTGSESSLLVMADQKTPFATLKSVVNSAASAGFVDLQLVVVQAD